MKRRDRTLWFLGGALATLLALLAGVPFAANALVPEAVASVTARPTGTPRPKVVIPTVEVPDWLPKPPPQPFPSGVPTINVPTITKPPVSVTPRTPVPTRTPGPCDAPIAASKEWRSHTTADGAFTFELPANWTTRGGRLGVSVANRLSGCDIPIQHAYVKGHFGFMIRSDVVDEGKSLSEVLPVRNFPPGVTEERVWVKQNGEDAVLSSVTWLLAQDEFPAGTRVSLIFKQGDRRYFTSGIFLPDDPELRAVYDRILRSLKW